MPDHDYRALCAELVEAYAYLIDRYMTAPSNKDALVYRARTALNQPELCNLHREMVAESAARGARAALAQPEPVAPTDAASRVAHYLEQRRLIRGLDAEVINALHAGTDEPRQAALTVSDLEALARWGTPANNTREENLEVSND